MASRRSVATERGEGKNDLGFWEEPVGVGGFDPATNVEDRLIRFDGPDRPVVARAGFGPGGCRARGKFPAQAQVAAWARGHRAPGQWLERLVGRLKKVSCFFLLSIFRSNLKVVLLNLISIQVCTNVYFD